MTETPERAEDHTLRGTMDRPALLRIRDIIEKMEPLASAQFEDYFNPSVLEVVLNDGLCKAGGARINTK